MKTVNKMDFGGDFVYIIENETREEFTRKEFIG